MRYPASVAPVRMFAVSDLAVAESGNVVARDGAINVSWNIGDLITTNDERFTQTMEIDLLSCGSTDITPVSTSITIPATDRAITLLTSQLPNPLNGSLTATQSECTYGLQLLGRIQLLSATQQVRA